MRLKTHAAMVKVHPQLGVVVVRLRQPGHSIHKAHGLGVVAEPEGLFNDHVGTVTTQTPIVKLGQICYYFCSC